VDNNLIIAVRVLVDTASILHNYDHGVCHRNCSSADVWRIRSFAGSQVFLCLEAVSSNKRLAGASLDELKALFLVMLATTIAVGYSQPVPRSDSVSDFSMDKEITATNVSKRFRHRLSKA